MFCSTGFSRNPVSARCHRRHSAFSPHRLCKAQRGVVRTLRVRFGSTQVGGGSPSPPPPGRLQAVGWVWRQPACPSKHVVRRMGPSLSVWQTLTTRTVRYQELSPRFFATITPSAQRGVAFALRSFSEVGSALSEYGSGSQRQPPPNVPTPLFGNEFPNPPRPVSDANC